MHKTYIGKKGLFIYIFMPSIYVGDHIYISPQKKAKLYRFINSKVPSFIICNIKIVIGYVYQPKFENKCVGKAEIKVNTLLSG